MTQPDTQDKALTALAQTADLVLLVAGLPGIDLPSSASDEEKAAKKIEGDRLSSEYQSLLGGIDRYSDHRSKTYDDKSTELVMNNAEWDADRLAIQTAKGT